MTAIEIKKELLKYKIDLGNDPAQKLKLLRQKKLITSPEIKNEGRGLGKTANYSPTVIQEIKSLESLIKEGWTNKKISQELTRLKNDTLIEKYKCLQSQQPTSEHVSSSLASSNPGEDFRYVEQLHSLIFDNKEKTISVYPRGNIGVRYIGTPDSAFVTEVYDYPFMDFIFACYREICKKLNLDLNKTNFEFEIDQDPDQSSPDGKRLRTIIQFYVFNQKGQMIWKDGEVTSPT